MASIIRPEIRAGLWRWREVFAALIVLAVGVWIVRNSFGYLNWLGWAVSGAAVLGGIAGLQLGRFRRHTDGKGVVTIRERRIAYLGPEEGGMIDLDLLSSLAFDPARQSWTLRDQKGTRLSIPVSALGADALFDLFVTLPGLRASDLIAVLETPPAITTILWQQSRLLVH